MVISALNNSLRRFILSRFSKTAIHFPTGLGRLLIRAGGECISYIRKENDLYRRAIRFPTRLGCFLHKFVNNIVRMEACRRLHLGTLLFGVINTGRPRYLLDKLVWTKTNCGYGRLYTCFCNTPALHCCFPRIF
jgi:hypothetical protein